jgi:NAD(P)-dependent dehydrogenase (short-subunit alcohol dehydrogenase family)
MRGVRVNRLAGKVAIVTGAARGIGRAIAMAMSTEGASVVIGDVSGEGAEQSAASIRDEGRAAIGVAVDVSVRTEVEMMVGAAADAFGTPSVLVCAAGITTAGGETTFLELSDGEWGRVFDVNLGGTFLCSQVVARRMVASGIGGSIITFSSIGAQRPMFGVPAYHTSKAAVSGLTRALAVNLAHHGIRANALAPGYILTDKMRSVLGDEERYQALVSRVPEGRLGHPEDVVGSAIFLASDESTYVTGHVMHVDGGAFVLGWTPAQNPTLPPSDQEEIR